MPDPNPFHIEEGPEEQATQAEANQNPFHIPEPKNLPDAPTSAETTQSQMEQGQIDAAQEFIDTPPRSANTEREWARVSVEFKDLPTPKSYPEAISMASKTHGQSYRPNPSIMHEIETYADRMTALHMSRSGLMDKHGPINGVTKEMVDEFRGAFLHNFTALYGDPSPEEIFRVNQRAITTLAEGIQSNALSRIQRAEQTGATRDNQILFESANRNLESAQEDFAMSKELMSMADNPRYQSWFLGTTMRAVDQLTMLSPETPDGTGENQEANELRILQGILQVPFKQAQKAGWPDAANGSGPIAERMDGLLSRNLHLTDGEGNSRGLAMQRSLAMAYRGTLTEERVDMFNIPPEAAQTVTPSSMLVYTHPRLVGSAANILALEGSRERTETQLAIERMEAAQENNISLPDGQVLRIGGTVLKNTDETKEPAAEPQVLERDFFSAVDSLLNQGIAPLLQLRIEADTSVRTGGDEFVADLDKMLDGLGLYAMTYSDNAGDAIGVAEKFYEESGINDFSRTILTLGAMGAETQKAMDIAEEEGENDAKLAVDSGTLSHHSNKWLADIGHLSKQVEDGDRLRMGLTKEASDRIFNAGGNSARVARIALADEVAALAAERFAPLGFSPNVIREQFRLIRSEEFGRRLDNSMLRGLTEEEFQAMAQRVRISRNDRRAEAVERGFSEGPSMGAAFEEMKDTISLAVGFMGRDLRSTTQMLMEEPDDLSVLAATGSGGGYITSQLLRGAKHQTFGRAARMLTMKRAEIVMRRVMNNSPDVADQVRRVTTRLQKSQKGATGMGQREAVLEAAVDALDYASDARKFLLDATPDMRNTRLQRWYDGLQRDAERKASGILRHIDPREVADVMDDLQIDGLTRQWIQDGGVFSTLRQQAQRALGFSAG
ncbi:MAG: hypothetical protein V3S01_08065, partial [Dehalococcoidia bacterium]